MGRGLAVSPSPPPPIPLAAVFFIVVKRRLSHIATGLRRFENGPYLRHQCALDILTFITGDVLCDRSRVPWRNKQGWMGYVRTGYVRTNFGGVHSREILEKKYSTKSVDIFIYVYINNRLHYKWHQYRGIFQPNWYSYKIVGKYRMHMD